ncbi:MAG TPA: nicotinate-nucleotide adenylyltransferase [Azospira sp.]|nr:nicotinate-nucleotide adenylyltransferase [Azospira sp.]HNN07312.1 nicotinate-nucleotide adenylyltransferase [Azospira sp.]HNN44997.1 nicotinate-nucleotide adenylyltransferase [Azospira sp.]
MPESAGNDAPLGIFGGTFDPVHFGHLRLAGEAIAQLGLSGVRWIPAGQPRHREPPRVAAVDRLQMVRLALAGDPRFSVDAAEVESGEASYTVPTLERLRAEFGPRRSLVLLLGADAYAGLPTWHHWRELFSLAHIAVTLRPGHALAGLPSVLAAEHGRRLLSTPAMLAQAPAGGIITFAMTPLDVSATQIRTVLAAAGHTARAARVSHLLPQAVIDYIDDRHLYQNTTTPTDSNDGS